MLDQGFDTFKFINSQMDNIKNDYNRLSEEINIMSSKKQDDDEKSNKHYQAHQSKEDKFINSASKSHENWMPKGNNEFRGGGITYDTNIVTKRDMQY